MKYFHNLLYCNLFIANIHTQLEDNGATVTRQLKDNKNKLDHMSLQFLVAK